ncbi:MAG: phosphoribosyl-AMP cyclohydrolase, partial [Candidatus Aureabacteria bacterium]|nr:phosphoribosyl-AMP cyclohydrolase [Candidatus Auribacterota bacterium]
AGYRSCFYRRLKEDGGYETAGEKVFDPGTVYK